MVETIRRSSADRLGQYGVSSAEVPPADLVVQPGRTILISSDIKRSSRAPNVAIRRIPIDCMAQLKRLIGIPDDRIEWADSKSELAGDAVPDSFTEMQALSANQLRLLRLASQQYLDASATSVPSTDAARNTAIS